MTDLIPVISDELISKMAREVARNLIPIDLIRDRYKLTTQDWEDVIASPMFRQRLTEELEIWNASTPMAITGRIGAKAATMIEESLAEVYVLIHDKAQPMAAKIEALKWAGRMAGIGERAGDVQGGDRVVLNINFTSDGKSSMHVAKVIEPVIIENQPDV